MKKSSISSSIGKAFLLGSAVVCVAGGCTTERYHGDIVPTGEGGVTFNSDSGSSAPPREFPGPDHQVQAPPRPVPPQPTTPPEPVIPPVVAAEPKPVQPAPVPDTDLENQALKARVSQLENELRDLKTKLNETHPQTQPSTQP